MNRGSLGRLARVDLRDIWISEATDFTEESEGVGDQ